MALIERLEALLGGGKDNALLRCSLGSEYLKAGVLVVCVVDPDTDSVQVHYSGKAMRLVGRDEELLLPEVLPGFRVTVREFFE